MAFAPSIARGVGFISVLLSCVLLGPDAHAFSEARSDSPHITRTGDQVLLRGEPFTGALVEMRRGRVLSRTEFRGGREHGLSLAFYPDGKVRFEKHFLEGRREGTHYGYWPNGRTQFAYHYERDLFDGEQKAYFDNGARAELRRYELGHEEGQQSFWNPEGRLVANYTFRKGRRYGIVGRFDCMPVASQ